MPTEEEGQNRGKCSKKHLLKYWIFHLDRSQANPNGQSLARLKCLEGGLQEFLAFWSRAVERPNIVGSSLNLSPEGAFRAMRSGLPAFAVKALFERWSGGLYDENRTTPNPTPRRWDNFAPPKRIAKRRVKRLIRAARALRRSSFRGKEWQTRQTQIIPYISGISLRALEALGRLCPELQRVAITRCGKRGTHDYPIRVRDLPWDEIAKIQAQMIADPSGRTRAAWAEGRRQITLLEARGLARGESPIEVSGHMLDKREAHEWLSSGAHWTPLEWLLNKLPAKCAQVRVVQVARWLLEVKRRGQWSALIRERAIRAPDGTLMQIRFIDRIDELCEADLDRGQSTGVERAFDRASERYGSAWLDQHRADWRRLQSLPPGWRLPHRIRHLATPAALVREGEEMRNCVAGYVPMVQRNQCVILSLRAWGHRSTAELSIDGSIRQHLGIANAAPHRACKYVLQHFTGRLPISIQAWGHRST